MYKKILQSKIFFFSFIVGLVFANLAGAPRAFAVDFDYSDSAFSWIQMVGKDGTTFTSVNGSHDAELMYGPLRVATTLTGVNSVSAFFKYTAGPNIGQYACPDDDLTNSYSAKFAGFEFTKVADSADSYTTVIATLGISTGTPYPYLSIPFGTPYQDTTTHGLGSAHSGTPTGTWTPNDDGSCSAFLTNTGDNTVFSSSIVDGWYILRFPMTSVDAHNTASYNASKVIDDADLSQISIVGDQTYKTAIQATYTSGTSFNLIQDAYSPGYFPFKPSFPRIKFGFMTPPSIPLETYSCNPFINDISTLYFNPNFSVSSCFKGIINWAFVPTKASLNQFSTLTLSDREPFSYLYDVGNLWNELYANTGSMDFDVSVDTGVLGTFQLISPAQLVAIPYSSTIKTILGWLFYFFTAMTLYRLITRVHDKK